MTVTLHPHYLGIDIAGASNTWMAVLVRTDGRPLLALPPQQATLAGIVDYAQEHPVVAAAIDAQLTWAASEEGDSGFRPCDRELQPETNVVSFRRCCPRRRATGSPRKIR